MPVMVDDNTRVLEGIAKLFGDKPPIGIFHSVSAVLASMTISRSDLYSALFLVDPPLYPPGAPQAKVDAALQTAVGYAMNRTEDFLTLGDFVDLLVYSPWFATTSARTQHLLAQTTLRRKPDGTGYELCCPREYEAMLVEHCYAMTALEDFKNLKCPVKVLGADPTLPTAFLPTTDLEALVLIEYDFIPDANHCLQLDFPLECVDVLLEFLTSSDVIDQNLADSCLNFAREQLGPAA